MFRHFVTFGLVCALHRIAAAQFVTFKDGKVGVNFGGYHAQAGLGGLLTGNAAHGGLSASAGTPWGPQAAAGLNGALNGHASGAAYAGAQLNPEVGASSVIGGTAGDDEKGFGGAEAHSSGGTVMTTNGVAAAAESTLDSGAPKAPQPNVLKTKTSSVQKIRPHKKYTLRKKEQAASAGISPAHSKQVLKSYFREINVPEGTAAENHHQHQVSGHETGTTNVRLNAGGLVGNVLNIPIGILRSLQDSLSGLDINKSVSYTKLS